MQKREKEINSKTIPLLFMTLSRGNPIGSNSQNMVGKTKTGRSFLNDLFSIFEKAAISFLNHAPGFSKTRFAVFDNCPAVSNFTIKYRF